MNPYNYFKDPLAIVAMIFCLAGTIALAIYWTWIAAAVFAAVVIAIFLYGRYNP